MAQDIYAGYKARIVALETENNRLRNGILDAADMIAGKTDNRDWVVLDRVKEYLEQLVQFQILLIDDIRLSDDELKDMTK